MRTAVWIVMCSEPVIRAPSRGLLTGVFLAECHQAGHLVFRKFHFLATETNRIGRQIHEPCKAGRFEGGDWWT